VSRWRLFYHIVWATKGREPLIDKRIGVAIERSILTNLEEMDAIPHALYLMPDHVHLAVSVPPRHSIADFMRHVKGASSRLLNVTESQSDLSRFAWQTDYGIVTFSERSLKDVVAYVENQAAHHANNNLWPIYENDGSLPNRETKI
jgi:putative transposase